jgi:cell division transport system ATP-binding protein
MIRFEHVNKRYSAGHDALVEMNFELGAGEMAFITGHSGAGKSTLLKLVALLERPTRGQVIVNGHNHAQLKRRRVPQARRGIGMVFQDHRLLMDRSVFDNVALPLLISGTPRDEIGKRVRASLDKVGLLGREQDPPVNLSTGEQQRVGIARAVVGKPAVLIADEPTGNLDPALALEVMKLFKRFQDVGVTVIVATHDLHVVHEFGQRTIVLDDGQVLGSAEVPLPSMSATR